MSDLNDAQLAAANRIVASQVVALSAITDGKSPANGSQPVTAKEEALAASSTVPSLPTGSASQLNPEIAASASAALPKLLAVQLGCRRQRQRQQLAKQLVLTDTSYALDSTKLLVYVGSITFVGGQDGRSSL